MRAARFVRGAVAAAALTSTACESRFFEDPAPAEIATIAFDLSAVSAGGPREAFDKANRVRLRVSAGSRTISDQVIPTQPNGQDLQLPVNVALRRRTEDVTLDVDVRLGDVTLFRASAPARIRIGGRQVVTVSLVPVPYAFVLPALAPLTAYGDVVSAQGAIVFATGDTLAIGQVDEWTSLDPAIVRIEAGLPVARGDGTARLVGRNGQLVDTTTVSVIVNAISLVIDPNGAQIPIGTFRQFTAQLFDRRGNSIVGRNSTWTTSDASRVTVDQTGRATAVGLGPANLTATSGSATSVVVVHGVPGPPDVETDTVKDVTRTTATFRADVLPNGAATEMWFEYAQDSLFTNSVTTAMTPVGAGLTPLEISTGVTGLVSGSTYFVRAHARNPAGADRGRTLKFTTPRSQLSVQTGPVMDVCNGTVTVQGSVFPGGAPAQVWVEWAQNQSLQGAQASPPQSIAASNGSVSISVVLFGITQGTTYYYRVIARNTLDTVVGQTLSFTACQGPNSGNGPTVVTGAATGITMSGAVLNGSINPNGSAATVWFDWGTTPGLAAFTRLTPQQVGSGTAVLTATGPLSGLAPNATYYFRVGGANAADSAFGQIVSFTTLVDPSVNAPSAATLPAAPIFSDSAFLHGTVNPNGASALAWFEYGTDPALATSSMTAPRAAGSGSATLNFDEMARSLAPGTTYYFRMVASTAGGTTRGAIVSFTTPPGLPLIPPTISTDSAAPVWADSAYLHATVNPQGRATTVRFEYGTSPGTLSSTTVAAGVGSGTTPLQLALRITGLTPGVTYFYRAVATSSGGTSTGAILSFTTLSSLPGGPTATTDPAMPVQDDSAVVNGTVNPSGSAGTAWFEWGTNPTLATFSATPVRPVGSGTFGLPVAELLTGLTPGTTYYFRVVISTIAGTVRGNILSFTAVSTGGGGPPSATTLTATNIGSGAAQLNGTVNPNGAPTAYWFEYFSDGGSFRTPVVFIGSGAPATVSATLTGLPVGHYFDYRIVAFNPHGTAVGATLFFVAQAPD